MHSYLHNIKTFNNATRHLTGVERLLYRDAIELYYDTEQPLPAVDFDRLARRLRAVTPEEKAALQYILTEFFELTGDVYTHHFCDEVIEAYKNSTSAKSIAGKASAAARKKKAEERRAARSGKTGVAKEQDLTPVEQTLNTTSAPVANHEPLTINHKKDKTLVLSPPAEAQDPSPTVTTIPTNRFNTTGETFRITEDMLPDWEAAYPAVDVRQEILKAKTWLQDNPTKRKTVGGMRRFLGSWLSRQQDRGQPNAEIRRNQPPGASRQSKSDAIREATFSDNW